MSYSVMKENNFEKLPQDLKSMIAANGHAMRYFYALPTEERERLLESVSDLNKRLNEYKKFL